MRKCTSQVSSHGWKGANESLSRETRGWTRSNCCNRNLSPANRCAISSSAIRRRCCRRFSRASHAMPCIQRKGSIVRRSKIAQHTEQPQRSVGSMRNTSITTMTTSGRAISGRFTNRRSTGQGDIVATLADTELVALHGCPVARGRPEVREWRWTLLARCLSRKAHDGR